MREGDDCKKSSGVAYEQSRLLKAELRICGIEQSNPSDSCKVAAKNRRAASLWMPVKHVRRNIWPEFAKDVGECITAKRPPVLFGQRTGCASAAGIIGDR